MISGLVGAVIAGIIMPSISLVMANIAMAFSGQERPQERDEKQDLTGKIFYVSGLVLCIAFGIAINSYIFFAFWQRLAANITFKLKQQYIEALLNQEVAYFELNKVEQIPAQINECFDTLQNSIGEKVANLVHAISTCVASIVYACIYGWEFALICCAYLPFLMGVIAIFGKRFQKATTKRLDAIKSMCGQAEEALMSIKTVTAFGQEDLEISKFKKKADKAYRIGLDQQKDFGNVVGMTKFAIFFFYAYSLSIGSVLMEHKVNNSRKDKAYDAEVVIQTIIALITGFVGLIAALPNIQSIAAATAIGA